MEQKAQAAVEYLLLIALGLAVALVAIAIILQLKGLGDSVISRVGSERNGTLSVLVH